MIYIGIDNGVGSIGIITPNDYFFYQTPIIFGQDYTKTKKNISRIDFNKLLEILLPYEGKEVFVRIERPMINSFRFNASITSARALEAILIVVEMLNMSYQFLDSKAWQKELLPNGVKTSIELKVASFDIGSRLFPKVKELIKKHTDADGMLIAEWMKRFQQGTLTKVYKNP